MLKIRVKSQFKKDLKKSLSDKKRNTQLLKELIDNHLCITGSVPAEYLPHPLKGTGDLAMNITYNPIFY
ncbi:MULTISPECIES: hypothetical protein [unclassified Providencia]|uniref:hypothetical protein n=1 Tax=unclassified Providencia TaxID=2633465 RepID=UPI002349F24C|nr:MULTISPECIES: hypothetical protein [unclassified Providencia]